MKFFIKKIGEKGGIAMVITLALLAMTLATAISLVSLTSTGRISAANYNTLQQARMLSQTGLQRTLMGIRIYANDISFDMNKLTSRDTGITSSTSDTGYGIYRESLGGPTGLMSVTINGDTPYYVTFRTDTSIYYDTAPTWIYVRSQAGGNSQVLGRYAYRVIAPTGSTTDTNTLSNKIDLSACLDSGYNSYVQGGSKYAVSEANRSPESTYLGGGSGTYTLFLGRDGVENTSLRPDGSYVVGRPGCEVNEVFTRCMDDNKTWINAVTGKYYNQKISSYKTNPAGLLKSGTGGWVDRWSDIDSFATAIGLTPAEKTTFNNYCIFGNQPDPEAYWCDLNLDFFVGNNELFNRFNLARTDWDSLDTSSIICSPSVYSSSVATSNGTGIPWIANWNSITDKYWTKETMREQLAANLIDYCDSNDTATADSTDTPTYVGLEKCPYINEVRLQIDADLTRTGNRNTKYTYKCTVVVTNTSIEVADMFGANVNVDAQVTMAGQFDWFINGTSPLLSGHSSFDNTGNPLVLSSIAKSSTPGYHYDTLPTDYDISPTPSSFPGIDNSTLTCTINNFKLTKLKVKLVNSTTQNFYDYSYIVDTGYAITDTIANNVLKSNNYLYLDFQTDDPRQNLYPTDWGNDSPYEHTSAANGTLGARNDICNVNPGGNDADIEPVTGSNLDPWDISSAFIRNAPMMSPWELGIIHRGKKWQTLNLKKFDPSKDYRYELTSGGDTYANGDANILDQVKMTSNTSTYGKFDLNSNIDVSVFKALFEKIRIGSLFTYGTPDQGPGTLQDIGKFGITATIPLTNVEAAALSNAVKSASAANTGGLLHSRAEVLSTNLSSYTSRFWDNTLFASPNNKQTADAVQEEIIGKFINLTKAGKPSTSNNIYYVIVVSQAIKDVNNAGSQGTYNIGIDKTLSTQRIIGIIQNDPAVSSNLIIQTYYDIQ